MIYNILGVREDMLRMISVTYDTNVKDFDRFIAGTGWVRDDLQQGPADGRGVVLVNTDDRTDTLFVPFYQYLVRLGDDLLVYDKHEINEMFVV